jgi:hypothetical protein
MKRMSFLIPCLAGAMLLLGTGALAEAAKEFRIGTQNPNIRIRYCPRDAAKAIDTAVTWLKRNMRKIDRLMGRNHLMAWPRNSRKKFRAKLYKQLKFTCADKQKLCKKWGGSADPVFHRQRIRLCMNKRRDSSGKLIMSSVIGLMTHEMAHLVRVNTHTDRGSPKKKYCSPGFSELGGICRGKRLPGERISRVIRGHPLPLAYLNF